MIEYASIKVTKSLKQYDMLEKSLKYISNNEEKTAIYYQMTRITEQIIEETKEIYESQYNKLLEKKTYLMEEEKNKLHEIINLINERRAYINNQINSNREITKLSITPKQVLGEDKIEEYKNRVKIIEKYNSNLKLHDTLVEEIKELNTKTTKAKTKIENNKYLNVQLENKMKKILKEAFDKLNLYELKERVKEIDLAYTELGYSLEKAKENAKLARKNSSEEIIIECDNMLSSITLEYERYKEKKLILKLMDMYENPVNNYEELLAKREIINNILNNIVSSELYHLVGTELNKQYNTIKLESQDVNTLESLLEEKDNKNKLLFQIEEENSSHEFDDVLKELLENERQHQLELLEEKRKQEEERRRIELEERKRKQQEMLEQQKILEEERNKEIEQRTKQMLREQQKSILNTKEMPLQKKKVEEVLKTKPKAITQTRTTQMTNRIETPTISNGIVNTTINNRRIEPLKPTTMPNKETTPKIPTFMPNNSNRKPQPEKIDTPSTNSQNNISQIPIIKNNNLNNEVIGKKTVDIPKVTSKINSIPLEKETRIEESKSVFPELPQKDESFFDDDEMRDLNNYMEGEKKNSWF